MAGGPPALGTSLALWHGDEGLEYHELLGRLNGPPFQSAEAGKGSFLMKAENITLPQETKNSLQRQWTAWLAPVARGFPRGL